MFIFNSMCKIEGIKKNMWKQWRKRNSLSPHYRMKTEVCKNEKENEGQKYNGQENLGSWILPICVFECFHIEFCRDFFARAEQ